MTTNDPQEAPGYPPLVPAWKTGDEPFVGQDGGAVGFDLREFWSWVMSDLVTNTTRGILAEFLVAKALGLAREPRADWLPYDLTTADGVKVEVKSSGYLQSWFHHKLSRISFGIRATQAWDGNTGEWVSEPRIHADVYVFCLLGHTEKASVDPLRLEQWQFYVLHADVIRERMAGRKSISLAEIHGFGLQPVPFHDIAAEIRRVAPRGDGCDAAITDESVER
jgi:hypothetical protein